MKTTFLNLVLTLICVNLFSQDDGLKPIVNKEPTALEKFKAKFNKGKGMDLDAFQNQLIRALTFEDMPPSPATNNQEAFRVGFLESASDGSKGLIVFGTNKYELTSESKKVLNKLALVVTSIGVGELEINIAGHTDDTGSDEYNLKLSDKRANSVKTYLVSMGVPSNYIKTIGYGETKPYVANDNSINRAMNRRVEFDFYGSEE